MRLAKFTITALILGSFSLSGGAAASALDHVVLRREGKQIEVAGKLLVTAQDGGLLLMANDGVLWAVTPDELVSKSSDAAPFEPLGAKELGAKLLAELPAGFDRYDTAHYLIVYNTSRGYAQWCGSLFERLYMAFTNYWTRKGFELSEPEFPLVALVFADRRSYADYARAEIGDNAGSIIGYFSLASNRMAMYDLTGTQSLNRTTDRNSAAEINRILAQPAAERIVATIVHEATHQIAFNCGLHTRYSDCPLWFSEGIAIYFETPDLGSSRGWRSIGTVNTTRLAQFRQLLRSRPSDSLVTLIRDDERSAQERRDPRCLCRSVGVDLFPHPAIPTAVSRLSQDLVGEDAADLGRAGDQDPRVQSGVRRGSARIGCRVFAIYGQGTVEVSGNQQAACLFFSSDCDAIGLDGSSRAALRPL